MLIWFILFSSKFQSFWLCDCLFTFFSEQTDCITIQIPSTSLSEGINFSTAATFGADCVIQAVHMESSKSRFSHVHHHCVSAQFHRTCCWGQTAECSSELVWIELKLSSDSLLLRRFILDLPLPTMVGEIWSGTLVVLMLDSDYMVMWKIYKLWIRLPC